jgi:hypothetical protein
MPSVSPEQQGAAGAALDAKRKGTTKGLKGPAKGMAQSMNITQLRHFAGTKHSEMESLRTIGSAIVSEVLGHDDAAEESNEVASARTILSALKRLQASLTNPSPEQTHALTTIRAAANNLIRIHQ